MFCFAGENPADFMGDYLSSEPTWSFDYAAKTSNSGITT